MFVSASIFAFICFANGILAIWRLIGKRSIWVEFTLHAMISILAGIVANLQYREALKERRHTKSS
jgi:hypothetical protein